MRVHRISSFQLLASSNDPATHDLRRTAATIPDEAGYSLEKIGSLLAHTREGVTKIYARWDQFDLRRELATVLERSLREILDGDPVAAIKTAA